VAGHIRELITTPEYEATVAGLIVYSFEARVPFDASKGRIAVKTDSSKLRSNMDFTPLR
jgi:hypothetical protein